MIALPNNRIGAWNVMHDRVQALTLTQSVLVVTFLRWVAAIAAATLTDGREIGDMDFDRFTKGKEREWIQTSMRSICYG